MYTFKKHWICATRSCTRRVWRYPRGNQNP